MGTGALTVGERASTEQRISFADCWITTEAQQAAQRVLASGWVTTGQECRSFETEFATYVGARDAVAVSSCTAGIELALRSLGLHQGSPVLTSTMTFCGAVHAIEHAGLRPVLVDVDPVTGMPTEETVARAAGSCDRKPAAMVARALGRRPVRPGRAGRGGRAPRGPGRRGRRARPRRRARGGPRWAPGRWPASASTPPRTCRSARAGWSPPTTPTAPPGCAGPGCTG